MKLYRKIGGEIHDVVKAIQNTGISLEEIMKDSQCDELMHDCINRGGDLCFSSGQNNLHIQEGGFLVKDAEGKLSSVNRLDFITNYQLLMKANLDENI